MIRTVLVSLVLIALVVVGGRAFADYLASLKEEPARVERETSRTIVRVVRPVRGDHRERVGGYGEVRALKRAVVAAEISGLVTGVSEKIRVGTTVEAGEELVTLDAYDLNQQLDQARANARRVKASLARVRADLEALGGQLIVAQRELAVEKRELERLQGLSRSSSSAISEVDSQILAVGRAERVLLGLERSKQTTTAQLAELDEDAKARAADVLQAEKNQRRARIVAPWSGVIESRSIEAGQRVAPGSELFRIVDVSRVEVAVVIGASHYGEVSVGAEASLRLQDDGPVVWTGPVRRIAPRVELGDRTFTVFIEVATSDCAAPIPPGSFVLAEVPGRLHRGVYTLPRTAFLEGKIFVAETKGAEPGEARVSERRPEIVRQLAGEALITAGIEPGEAVIVTNLEEITAGMAVRVAADDATNGDGR